MDVVFSLVGVLGLLAGLVLAVLGHWDRQRSRRAVIEAETELRISREAAARQLLELRKRLAEAESDQAHIASLQDEVRRLREKIRRLQAASAAPEPDSATGPLPASQTPTQAATPAEPSWPSLDRLTGPGGPVAHDP
jgi:predicted ATP-grasp superfamily ATP-dependent carboligase